MEKCTYLPYSDEKLALLMGVEPCEFRFWPSRDKIKRVVRDYNLFCNSEMAIVDLTKIKESNKTDKTTYDAITKLILCIKLR